MDMGRKDKDSIFELAKEMVVKHNLIFVEDIIAFIPISKPTFYSYYPVDSNEFNELKALLDLNRIELKVSMRSKWYKSNAPALQMALMKLIATPDELKRLAMQYVESDNKNDNKTTIINLGDGKPIAETE